MRVRSFISEDAGTSLMSSLACDKVSVMKKIIAVIMVFIMIFSMASCGKKEEASENQTEKASESTVDSKADTVTEAPAKPTDKPKVTIVDAPPRATKEPDSKEQNNTSDNTAGKNYFESKGIEKNTELGAFSKFLNGACYTEAFGTGYAIISPYVKVEQNEYVPDDGKGVGHYSFTMYFFCQEEKPKGFKDNYVSIGFGLYDRYSGKEIKPMQSADDENKLFRITNDKGDYDVYAFLKGQTYNNVEGYYIVLEYNCTVYFDAGYKGMSLIVVPALSDRDSFEEWTKDKDYTAPPDESKYCDLDNSLIFDLF